MSYMEMGRHKRIVFTHDLWLGYSWFAKNNEIPFNLTEADVEEIAQLPCFFCEQKGRTQLGYKTVFTNRTFRPYKANKLVTLDRTKGYIYENIVPCCINHLKNHIRFKNIYIVYDKEFPKMEKNGNKS